MKTLLACAVMASACVANGQPVQWRVEDGGNGHWYEYRAVAQSWTKHRVEALALGGDLASLETLPEVVWTQRFGWDYHVGGIQRQPAPNPAANWYWLSGVPVSSSSLAYMDDSPCNCCSGEAGRQDGLFRYDSTRFSDTNVDDFQDYCPYHRGALIEWSADCNGDGIVDKGQILSGQLPDANNNGIPDWSVSIVTQPINQSVGVDQPVYFTVGASSTPGCTNPINYRWQRRNPIVLNDNSPDAWIDLQDGGGFLNTSTASMVILQPIAGLATGYRCKVSGGCSCEPNSNAVTYSNIVNFAPACPSDFNNDGSVDGDDVIAFFERWDVGC